MTGRKGRIRRDVHRLARAYHWSWRDVLALSIRAREEYLLLIEAAEDQTRYLAPDLEG